MDIASKLGYVTVMETLKDVSEPSISPASQEKYKVVAPETMLETFMSDSEEEGGEMSILSSCYFGLVLCDVIGSESESDIFYCKVLDNICLLKVYCFTQLVYFQRAIART